MNINLNISKRNFIRIISFSIAIILVLIGLIFTNMNAKNKAIKQLEYQYLKNLQNLGTYLDNIDSSITKAMYSGSSDSLSEISGKLWRESGFAKDCLSSLPMSNLNLSKTYKFISQLGEYSLALSRKSKQDQVISQKDFDNLSKLRSYSNQLLNEVLYLEDAINTGYINVKDISKDIKNSSLKATTPNVTDGFTEFEEGFSDYPTLIYDGPFSDHILEKESEVVKQNKEISMEQAKEKASKILNVDVSKITDSHEEKGKMPAYCFSYENYNIAISKNGGYLIYLLNNTKASNQVLSIPDCINKAKEFLKLCGYQNLAETYHEISNNVITINFAYHKDDITYYTDLIKVSINMQNGEVCSFDARGYLNNHKNRDNLKFTISEDVAKQSVSKLLNIEKINKTVIPINTTEESICYEFKCTTKNNENILVYINGNTGKEEQLLILYIDENGSLTI